MGCLDCLGDCFCCCPGESYEAALITERASMKQSKDRKCTDCCCCILFFLSCGVMFLIQLAATSLGNPDMLLHGTDYTGATCGMGQMAAKPYTAYPRLGLDLIDHRDTITTAPWNVQLYGLCVEECPAQDVDVTDYICESVPDSSSCKWSSNPLVSYDEPNVWHTAVGTSSLMGRCLAAPSRRGS